MIIRKQPDGEIRLLTQTDHSRLAGFLASHWGNADFASLEPYESVARAATFHDFGWLPYETNPDLDPATGQPFTFMNLPFRQSQLAAYQWCVDWLADIDRYSALLVGMHRVGLWKSRYNTISFPEWKFGNIKGPAELLAYIDREEPRQAAERDAIGGQTIWTNYRLLQVWDMLGLYFTCGEPYEHAVEPVPTQYDGDLKSGVRMTLHPLTSSQVALDPYPFDLRPLTLHIPYRVLPSDTFADVESFRKAYYQAVPELLTYEVV
jgi:hypothetical protein